MLIFLGGMAAFVGFILFVAMWFAAFNSNCLGVIIASIITFALFSILF